MKIYRGSFKFTQKFTKRFYFKDCEVEEIITRFLVEISGRLYKIVKLQIPAYKAIDFMFPITSES